MQESIKINIDNKIKDQIKRLAIQYKSYEKCNLGDLALEINHVKKGEQFKERDNAIYIQNIGNFQVLLALENDKNHQHYFQLILRKSVINEYIAPFFQSEIGRLIGESIDSFTPIDSLSSGTAIPRLTKEAMKQIIVVFPSLDEQKIILQTRHKLHNLKNSVDRFNIELALNPTNASLISSQLDMMLNAIGALTDADKIRSFVREGETKYVEFKETLSLDLKKQTKETYIDI